MIYKQKNKNISGINHMYETVNCEPVSYFKSTLAFWTIYNSIIAHVLLTE